MAAESESPSYPNGVSGRSRGAEDDKPTTSRASWQFGNDDGVAESTSAKSPGQATIPQIPRLSSDPSTVSTVSRESSPTRPSIRASNSASTSRVPSLPRKGSENRSPGRSSATQSGPSSLPSASAVQQASKSIKPPALSPPPNAEPPKSPSPDESIMPALSPSRRPDQDPALPNISSKRSVPPDDNTAKGDRSTPRSVSRGLNGSGSALETVQETASDQSTPSTDTTVNNQPPEEYRLPKIDEDATPKAPRQNVESGSDSGGNKSSGAADEARTSALPGLTLTRSVIPKQSSTSLSGSRGKPTDGSIRNMTVETETVSTIPQVSLGVAAVDRGNLGRSDQGTIRMKPSTETIRPKKEKRKTRRPAALTSGGASSKADIFEAKVASAVDEADVSDSDETFVYESNPPDPYPVRQGRYHSRTPSATSMASQVDQFAGRPRAGLRDGNHSVTGKRSMKFTNNTYNSSVDGEAGDEGGRHSRADSGTHTPRRHHIGRYGRNNMYPTLFDGDGVVSQAQPSLKSPKHFVGSGFRQPRHAALRNVPNYRTISSSKKMGDVYGFDYDAEGADDERTPLVGSPRITRSRHGRRPNSASLRQMEYLQRRQQGGFARYCTSFLIGLLVLLVIGGATMFVVYVTKSLIDVQVIAIQNVLASEQEIMLDLNVQAINPNLFQVAVDDMDVNIFARSRFVGTDSLWRDYGSEKDRFSHMEDSRKRGLMSRLARCLGDTVCIADTVSEPPIHPNDGVDRGTDPIETDPAGDPQTMLLGRVFRFDSPLAFEPSPWNHHASRSKGQIRLARPGNKTEEGGTERWERVLQHQFELIVRGVIQYQLPLSSRFYSASVSSSVKVVPQDDGDNNDGDNNDGDDNDGDGDGDGDGDDDGDDDPEHPPKNDTVTIFAPKLSRRKLYTTRLPDPRSRSSAETIRRLFTA